VKRFVALVAVFLVAALSLGCGGETGKNINKDKDRPKPVENAPS
jgi:hypothetical protein